MSVFQITIPLLYCVSGVLTACSRLPKFESQSGLFLTIGMTLALTGVLWNALLLFGVTLGAAGIVLSLQNVVAMIGLQLAIVACACAVVPSLRGLAGGLLLLAGAAAVATTDVQGEFVALSWQLRAHILTSIFAYGLLRVGAIVAVYKLVQDTRLRSGKLSPVNRLFAPLETNEMLLYGIASTGFAALLLGVVSGLTFVDDFFAQHLVHKSILSLIALLLFGVLIAGRLFAGWRGRRAVYLYLWGFGVLGLAYFGSRFILENLLGRSWG